MDNMTTRVVSSFITSKRVEEKFIIDRSLLPLIRNELKPFIAMDPNGIDDGSYSVQSLYFDDSSYNSYFDKINGNERREKFRVRFYNFDPTQLRFETKSKFASQSWKSVTSVKDSHFEFSYLNLMKLVDELGEKAELFKKLAPVLAVSYKRQGFISLNPLQNVRVTIDEKIISSRNISQLLKYRMGTPTQENLAIVEIKVASGLTPDWLKHIKNKVLIKSSFSKYIEAFNQQQIRV
jgi:SPX domain protein involved in polyphosphate accumulation